MMYDAEDKYADIIRLPPLAFSKNVKNSIKKVQKNVKTASKKAQKT